MATPALTTRSSVQALDPWAGAGALAFRSLLSSEAQLGAWRVVELWSVPRRPFEVRLEWAAGQGAGSHAWVTVPTAVRLGIYARAIGVRVANLSNQDNRVGVTVADGFLQSRNQYEVRGSLGAGGATALVIPPFAERVRLELSDPALYATTQIQAFDAQGVLRGVTMGDAQPDQGVPLGGAGSLMVVSAGVADFRAVFQLGV